MYAPSKFSTSNTELGWKNFISAAPSSFGRMSISEAKCAQEPTSNEQLWKKGWYERFLWLCWDHDVTNTSKVFPNLFDNFYAFWHFCNFYDIVFFICLWLGLEFSFQVFAIFTCQVLTKTCRTETCRTRSWIYTCPVSDKPSTEFRFAWYFSRLGLK